MNTHTEKTTVNKSLSSANAVSQKLNGGEATFEFVNNRPDAVAQRKLQKMVQESPYVKQLKTFQEMINNDSEAKETVQSQKRTCNALTYQSVQPQQITIPGNGSHHTGSGLIQRRGFADPAAPNSTRQWEGKGTLWRNQGVERPTAVANLVDQFKKEILTYIAHCIEARQVQGYYGPHVAVIITGNDWNVSVNSDVSAPKKGTLQADANAAKTHIDDCWNSLNNTYSADVFSPKISFENNEVEAAYIAFRWASSKTNVNVVDNPPVGDRRDGRRVHGEMQIINRLQAGAPALAGPPRPENTPPAGADPGWRRVVRVGGTKTPCLDCAWEMGKVGYTQDQINQGTVAPGAHGAGHSAHMIGAGPNERVATTMAPAFGRGFRTWQGADRVLPRRETALEPGAGAAPAAADFDPIQTQNYASLQAAYATTGCTPAMI